MKKKLSLLLSIVMMLSLFSGCYYVPVDENGSPVIDTTDVWGDASSEQLTPAVQPTPVSLPTPDPETSDMPTFYPGSDGFPEIGYGPAADDALLSAFRNEYGNTKIRIVYFYGEGPIEINGQYFMHCDDWYFEIPDEDVEIITELEEEFGMDDYENYVEGTVSMQTIPGHDECRMLLTDCEYDYATGTQFWKDPQYSDNPDGDGYYDDGNDPSSAYSGDIISIDINMVKAFDKNMYRFLDSYEDGAYMGIRAKVASVGSTSIRFDLEYEDPVWHQVSVRANYYNNDIYESGAINASEGSVITVVGFLNKSESEWWGDIILDECVFVP